MSSADTPPLLYTLDQAALVPGATPEWVREWLRSGAARAITSDGVTELVDRQEAELWAGDAGFAVLQSRSQEAPDVPPASADEVVAEVFAMAVHLFRVGGDDRHFDRVRSAGAWLNTQPHIVARHAEWLSYLDQFVAGMADDPHILKTIAAADLLIDHFPGGAQTFPNADALRRRLNTFVTELEQLHQRISKKGLYDPHATRKAIEKAAGGAGLKMDDAYRKVLRCRERWIAVAGAVRAGRLWPSVAEAEILEGRALLDEGDLAPAAVHFQDALGIDWESLAAKEGLALAQRDEHDNVDLDVIRSAVAAGSDDPAVLNLFAWTVAATATTQAELAEALQAAQRAVELAPLPWTWETLATVQAARRDTQAAIAASREAIRLDPGRLDYRKRLYELLGKPSRVNPVRRSPVFQLMRDPEPVTTPRHATTPSTQTPPTPPGPVAVPAPAAPTPARAPAPPATAPVVGPVDFTLTGPALMAPGNGYVVDVWAHLPSQRAAVLERAAQVGTGAAPTIPGTTAAVMTRGTPFTFRLRLPDGLVADDPQDSVAWDGDVAGASFPVRVEPDAPLGPRTGVVAIYAHSMRIATLHFVVEITTPAATFRTFGEPPEPLSAGVRRRRSAFASYADEDREEAMARINSVRRAAPELDVLADVASLRSGPNWSQRVLDEILSRDVMYLFWSTTAGRSNWVDVEWRTALDRRGSDFIDPVPLAAPDRVPPPAELSERIPFNEWALAYLRGAGERRR